MFLSRHTPFQPRILGACLLLGGLLGGVQPSLAEEAASNQRWVSDSLNTYVRSGPTDGYRIVGTLVSGEKVELLRTQGDYSQVRSASGSSAMAGRGLNMDVSVLSKSRPIWVDTASVVSAPASTTPAA